MKHELGIAVAAAVFIATHAQAQATDAEIRQILVNRVDVEHKSIGIAVGIVTPQGRRVVSYGRLDRGDPRPVDGDTLFEIGSVTKVFTSLLLADMVQRGEVALADPVAKYLPAGLKTPEWKGREIALVDLGTHTSGLPFFPSNFPPVEDRAAYGNYTVEQLYQFLAAYELPREPGTRWEYSNTGGGLLGLALGRRAGMDFETLVRTRITGPLGMASTGIATPPQMKPRLAAGHNERLESAPVWNLPALPAAGSLRSSANDLLLLLAAFTGQKKSPLAPAMAAMPGVVRPNQLYGLDQALGWFVIGKGDERFFIHGGGTFGFASSLAYDPKNQVGVVVLSNAAGSVDDIARHLLRPAMPLDKPQPLKTHKEIAVDAKLFDLYAGRYRVGDWVYTVTREGDNLRIQLPAAPKFRLHAETGKDYFIEEANDIGVTFQTDAKGRATGLILHIWGFNVPAPRLEAAGGNQ
jgi:serine-type D-Ala-D-Ala carboxypeptidase/endopeptidase